MKLTILDRVIALQVISEYQQGNFITFKTIAKLKDKLLANEDEVKKYNIRIEGEDYKWNEEGSIETVEIELTEAETKLIVDQLLKLDKENQLTANHIPLYEKFITVE